MAGRKKKTLDEYKKDVFNKWGNEYIITGTQYINNKEKIKTLHTTCNTEFDIAPNRLLSGNGCKECAKKKMSEIMKEKNITRDMQFKAKTHEDFIQELKEINSNISVLEQYINNETNIHVKCNICNHEWHPKPANLTKGQNCPECVKTSKRRFKNKEDLLIYLNSLNDTDKYEVLNFNGTLKEQATVKHLNCGYTFTTPVSNITKKSFTKCPKCNGHQIYTSESLNEMIETRTNNQYSYVKGFTNLTESCVIKHNKCNTEFSCSPTNIIWGRGSCPNCRISNASKPEDALYEFIKSIYKGEIKRNRKDIIKPYELDIYLPELNLAFEYNGNYWHSNKNRSDSYHQDKFIKCFNKRIRLISIFEYMLIDNEDKVKENIINIINDTNYPILENQNIIDLNFGLPSEITNLDIKSYRKHYLDKNKKSILNTETDSYVCDCGTALYKDSFYNSIKQLLDDNDIKFIYKFNMGHTFFIKESRTAIFIYNVQFLNSKYKNNIANNLLKLKDFYENKGYDLFVIYTNEISYKKEIIFSKLEYKLNLNKKEKIYARKCTIKEVSSGEKNLFLARNHIQGQDVSNIKLGLYFDDKLVSVMTFCKPRLSMGHKKDSSYDYELSRFCSDINYNVVGGFSKLFKYFERNYNWSSIITYADCRFSYGNLYNKNNFVYSHTSKPSYNYININKKEYHLEPRFKFRKQQLKDLFPDTFDSDKTEKEIMEQEGYYHVYNLGNLVFTYSK